MTYKEKFHSSQDWKEKIFLVSQFHSRRCIHTKTWKVKQTAQYFGVSVGLVSENLNLARVFDLLGECSSRAQAIKQMKCLHVTR